MPRVNTVQKTKKARKCGKCGDSIEIGQPYRWWKFRYGGKYVRCMKPDCSPKPSDLTQSAFLGGMAEAEQSLGDAVRQVQEDQDLNSFAEELRGIASTVRELGEEAQSSLDNMPEGLQQGDTGQLLEQRASTCEEIADALEEAADSAENAFSELPEDEPKEDWTDEQLNSLAGTLGEEEKEEDETREEYLDRLKEALEQKRQEALDEAVGEAECVDWSYE